MRYFSGRIVNTTGSTRSDRASPPSFLPSLLTWRSCPEGEGEGEGERLLL